MGRWKINREEPVLPSIKSISMDVTPDEVHAIHYLLLNERNVCELDYAENSLLHMINEILKEI